MEFRVRSTYIAWLGIECIALGDPLFLAICSGFLDPMVGFNPILQGGLIILGVWFVIEGLALRIYQFDEEGVRFYKFRSLKRAIPLERLKHVSFTTYNYCEGGTSKRIVWEPLSGKPITAREESKLKHTKLDIFGAILQEFCCTHQIPFYPLSQKHKIKKIGWTRSWRQRKILLQKILQMTTSINLTTLARTVRLGKRQVLQMAYCLGLALKDNTLVKPLPRQEFIEDLKKSFNEWVTDSPITSSVGKLMGDYHE